MRASDVIHSRKYMKSLKQKAKAKPIKPLRRVRRDVRKFLQGSPINQWVGWSKSIQQTYRSSMKFRYTYDDARHSSIDSE